MRERMIVFDMDGVLVDVTESYREAIQRTVEHFTGERPSRILIQDYKNRGGWNDDWALSTELIRSLSVDIELAEVTEYFQSIFHGDGTNGLILRERWLAKDRLFDRLSAEFDLAVFTGRLRWEAQVTLKRFAPRAAFDPIVGADDVEQHKPHPQGLVKIRDLNPSRQLWYVGDTVDDARCARAAGAPFIGIASLASPRRDDLIELFKQEQAIAVLEDINGVESVLL